MTSRYDELSEPARWFLNNFDELDLADLCASKDDTIARIRDTAEVATVRLKRAEAAIARVRAIPRLPHSSQQTGELGRAYTRGWESVISALDTALNQPKEPTP